MLTRPKKLSQNHSQAASLHPILSHLACLPLFPTRSRYRQRVRWVTHFFSFFSYFFPSFLPSLAPLLCFISNSKNYCGFMFISFSPCPFPFRLCSFLSYCALISNNYCGFIFNKRIRKTGKTLCRKRIRIPAG